MFDPSYLRYAVQHSDCGHIATVRRDRAAAVAVHGYLAEAGLHRWRIRHLTPEQAKAAATAIRDLEPGTPRGCSVCGLDDGPAAAVIAAVTMAGGAR